LKFHHVTHSESPCFFENLQVDVVSSDSNGFTEKPGTVVSQAVTHGILEDAPVDLGDHHIAKNRFYSSFHLQYLIFNCSLIFD